MACSGALKRSGMLTNDKGRTYDRFRERDVPDSRPAGSGHCLWRGCCDDKPKYLNSPETPVFQNPGNSMACGRLENTGG